MAFRIFSPTEIALWAATPVVVGVMALLFGSLPEVLGPRRGYLAAFAFYWGVFGFALPLAIAGGPVTALLRPSFATGIAGGAAGVLLVVPPLLAGLTVFRRRLREADARVLLVSAALALVNAAAEELLWHAAPVAVFRSEPVLALAIPALGFAVWHLAPQIALPTPHRGGPMGSVAGALVLGLCWALSVWLTGSALPAIASHALTDFLGLGGLAYVAGRAQQPALLAA